jgi:hypothetical protein
MGCLFIEDSEINISHLFAFFRIFSLRQGMKGRKVPHSKFSVLHPSASLRDLRSLMFNPQFCLFRNSSCACAHLRHLCHHSSRQRITSLGHPNGGGLGTRFRASEQSKLGSANSWRAWKRHSNPWQAVASPGLCLAAVLSQWFCKVCAILQVFAGFCISRLLQNKPTHDAAPRKSRLPFNMPAAELATKCP